MIQINKNISFSKYYKIMNISSCFLLILSIFIIFFKGLNFGVDFKGGTLIEIRTENERKNIADIRKSLLNMNLEDVSVKNFFLHHENVLLRLE